MNQPTRQEFEELKEEVRAIKQQLTEPIKITVERRQTEVESTLENHTELLKEISTKQDEQEQQLTLIYTDVGHMKADVGVLKQDVSVLKADVGGVKTDIAEIKTVQSGHSKFFEEHGKRLGRVEGDIADIKTALAEILNRLPPKQ